MECLRQLMAAYFHQDWSDEYDGAWTSAVDDFARREPRRIVGTMQEIDELISSSDSDAAVAQALDALGNFRDPGRASDAHITWLREIRERLDQSA